MRFRGFEFMKIKAAVFDMDGTLIDSLMVYRVCWRMLGEKFLGNPDFVPNPEIYRVIATMPLFNAASYVNSYHNLGVAAAELEEFCNAMEREFYENEVAVKDGAIELLEHLKQNGVKMALASATRIEMVRFAAEHLGLAKYFEHIVSCTEVGVGKDKPDVYFRAFELLGVDPADAAVFEDSFVAARTAKAIGAHTVGLFDPLSTGHDILKENSEIYIDKSGTLADAIKYIE